MEKQKTSSNLIEVNLTIPIIPPTASDQNTWIKRKKIVGHKFSV
jgi:hypothetical protein